MPTANPIPFDSLYLHSYLKPFARWLEHPGVNEILVNRPGEVWIEVSGAPRMQPIEAPEITDQLLEQLARQIARISSQGVNREHPLLAATLPSGARVQMAGPPATRRHWALAIRRHLTVELELEAFKIEPLKPPIGRTPRDETAEARRDPIAFLRRAVAERRTILISGGTSSGKTTFLNSLLKLVPQHERIVVVEDTPEIAMRQANAVGLIAVKGEMGEAKIGVEDLLQASLRLRPDRIIVGEIRGKEAATFLRAVNTGHPGSFTTVHASTPRGALEQIAFMILQAGWSLPRTETIEYAASVVDVIVQLSRHGGVRRIEDIEVLGGASSRET
jgi:type IV secretion system protein VirB11